MPVVYSVSLRGYVSLVAAVGDGEAAAGWLGAMLSGWLGAVDEVDEPQAPTTMAAAASIVINRFVFAIRVSPPIGISWLPSVSTEALQNVSGAALLPRSIGG